jgi:hypothetical protein
MAVAVTSTGDTDRAADEMVTWTASGEGKAKDRWTIGSALWQSS